MQSHVENALRSTVWALLPGQAYLGRLERESVSTRRIGAPFGYPEGGLTRALARVSSQPDTRGLEEIDTGRLRLG